MAADPLAAIRRFLLALFALGIVGTGAELVAFEHFEDAWQAIPIGLMTLAGSSAPQDAGSDTHPRQALVSSGGARSYMATSESGSAR